MIDHTTSSCCILVNFIQKCETFFLHVCFIYNDSRGFQLAELFSPCARNSNFFLFLRNKNSPMRLDINQTFIFFLVHLHRTQVFFRDDKRFASRPLNEPVMFLSILVSHTNVLSGGKHIFVSLLKKFMSFIMR
jgi:hypothetical protein